jgi:hypothetical protein
MGGSINSVFCHVVVAKVFNGERESATVHSAHN